LVDVPIRDLRENKDDDDDEGEVVETTVAPHSADCDIVAHVPTTHVLNAKLYSDFADS
jgi:hypothetical protein